MVALRHPQSQGSVKRANAVFKDKLRAWMQDNYCPKWAMGVRFVQWQVSTCVSDATKMERYKVTIGKKTTLGWSSSLPIDFFEKN